MPRFASRRVVVLPLLFVLALGAAACGKRAPLGPGFRALGPYATPEGGIAFERAGLTLRLREVRGSERAGVLRELAGARVDPFDVSKDGEPFFRTFVLDLA